MSLWGTTILRTCHLLQEPMRHMEDILVIQGSINSSALNNFSPTYQKRPIPLPANTQEFISEVFHFASYQSLKAVVTQPSGSMQVSNSHSPAYLGKYLTFSEPQLPHKEEIMKASVSKIF